MRLDDPNKRDDEPTAGSIETSPAKRQEATTRVRQATRRVDDYTLMLWLPGRFLFPSPEVDLPRPLRVKCRRQKTDEQRVKRLVQGWLDRYRWTEGDLMKAAKGDRRKAGLAVPLSEETPMTRQWITQELAMGSASYVSHLTGGKASSIVRTDPL